MDNRTWEQCSEQINNKSDKSIFPALTPAPFCHGIVNGAVEAHDAGRGFVIPGVLVIQLGQAVPTPFRALHFRHCRQKRTEFCRIQEQPINQVPITHWTPQTGLNDTLLHPSHDAHWLRSAWAEVFTREI